MLQSRMKRLVSVLVSAGFVLASIPSPAAQQSAQQSVSQQFAGRINPQLILAPQAKWTLVQKFAGKKVGTFEGKGGKDGKDGNGGKGKTESLAIESPPSGRYRVSIVGFRCDHETRDDVFAWDGLSDEIRLHAVTRVVDRDGAVQLQGEAQSRVMGSVNGDEWRRTRVHAGRADRFGGVRTGDDIPSSPAYAPVFNPREGIPLNPELPFLVFEGDLVQGLNAVVIVPTMWEVDGGGNLWPRFQTAINAAAPAIITAGATLAGGPTAGGAVGPAATATFSALDNLMTGIRGGDGGDRLIGLHRSSSGDGETFTASVVRLNYDLAELALRTRIGPHPPGILAINYRDDGDLNGNYMLYLKVERVDPVLPPP